jgi:hypothetical protein
MEQLDYNLLFCWFKVASDPFDGAHRLPLSVEVAMMEAIADWTIEAAVATVSLGEPEPLRRDRGAAFSGVKLGEIGIERGEGIIHDLPDLAQRVLRRHPLVKVHETEQRPSPLIRSAHARLHDPAPETKESQFAMAVRRGSSAAC